jgi:hypothetical protein
LIITLFCHYLKVNYLRNRIVFSNFPIFAADQLYSEMPQLERSLLPRNSRVTEHVCLHCEVTFFSTKPKTKYCSSKCRVYAHLDRKALKAQEEAAKEQITETINHETADVRPPVVIEAAQVEKPVVIEQKEEVRQQEVLVPSKPEKKEPVKAVVPNQMSLF